MKTLLAILFYQAIVAVNTAVIINGIIWLAKRKEKLEKKPNPDFTPPTEKEPVVELRSALIKTVNGEKFAHRWYSPDEQIPRYAILLGEPYKFFAEMDKDGGKLVEFVRIKPPTEVQLGGYQPKPCEMPKPPTTGTIAIAPKQSNRRDGIEIRAGYGNPIVGVLPNRGASSTEKIVETLDALKDDGITKVIAFRKDGEWISVCENGEKSQKDGVSTDEAAKLFSKLTRAAAGLGGNSKLDELEEKLKTLADTLDRIDKKPVTPERLKEAGFQTERVECRNCKHFLTTDEEYLTGTCGLNEEITFANSTKACFEPKPSASNATQSGMRCENCAYLSTLGDDHICAHTGLHVYAIGTRMYCDYFRSRTRTDRPKPLGTKTTH